MGNRRGLAVAVNAGVGAAGAAYLWWLALPLRSGSDRMPQVEVIVMLAGPALVVAACAGVVQVYLYVAGGAVLTTVATLVVLVVSGFTGLLLGALVVDAGWMPTPRVPLRPSESDLTTALAVWAVFTLGLFATAAVGLRRTKAPALDA